MYTKTATFSGSWAGRFSNWNWFGCCFVHRIWTIFELVYNGFRSSQDCFVRDLSKILSFTHSLKFQKGSLKTSLNVMWMQFVAGSQPVNAIAFVLDGLYYGVADFGFAAYAMVSISSSSVGVFDSPFTPTYKKVWLVVVVLEQVIAGFISSLVMLLAAPTYGLAGIWTGLFIFMALRLVAGAWR